MAKTVQIGSNTYLLPRQGEAAEVKGSKRSWGENLSDLIEALVDQVNTIAGPDDIPESADSILNTAGAKQIVAFHFNSSSVKSFESSYNVSRTITKEILSFTGNGVTTTITTGSGSAYNHDLRNASQITISGTGIPALDTTHTITKINETQFTLSSSYSGSSSGGQFDCEIIESGILYGNYSLNGWSLVQTKMGNSKLIFDIDNTGTITYSPTVLSGAVGSYEGLIKFVAKSLINV